MFRKYFFKKVVPGTSNLWPYHTDLLFFCLKFRLSPVCQYLNCYYSMANDYWAIPEKNQTGQLERTYLFEKKLLNFLGLSLYTRQFWKRKCFVFIFFNCYFPVPQPTLGHSQRESLTDPVLITAFAQVRPEGHREPRNKVGLLSLVERLVGFKPGTFRF